MDNPSTSSIIAGEPPRPMPSEIRYAYFFQIFNSGAFSMIMGVPMSLYILSLHKDISTTIMGILSAMAPISVILQVPAARFIGSSGYRRFLINGWIPRCLCLSGVVVTSFLPDTIDFTTRIVLVLILLLGFNVSRSISLCAYLPWMTQLVPREKRGKFVSRDQMFAQIASLFTLLACQLYFYFKLDRQGYGWLFLIATLMTIVSVFFLQKIPDASVDMELKSSEPVPWRAMIKYRPFNRLLKLNVFFLVAWASGTIYMVAFRETFHASNEYFIWMNIGPALITIVATYILGSVIEKTGSKPILFFGFILNFLHISTWGLVQGGFIPFTLFINILQCFTWSVGFAMIIVANIRLLMISVPSKGRSHFFAIFSVSNGIVSGIAPLVWGIFCDLLKPLHFQTGPLELNRFSMTYLIAACGMLGAMWMLRHVPESKAMSNEVFVHEMFVNTPVRALSKLFYRRRIGP